MSLVLLGIFAAPVMCIGSMLAIAILIAYHRSPTCSACLFLGFSVVGLLVFLVLPPANFGSFQREIVLLMVGSGACVADTFYFKRPDWHRVIAGLSVVVMLSYILFASAIFIATCD